MRTSKPKGWRIRRRDKRGVSLGHPLLAWAGLLALIIIAFSRLAVQQIEVQLERVSAQGETRALAQVQDSALARVENLLGDPTSATTQRLLCRYFPESLLSDREPQLCPNQNQSVGQDQGRWSNWIAGEQTANTLSCRLDRGDNICWQVRMTLTSAQNGASNLVFRDGLADRDELLLDLRVAGYCDTGIAGNDGRIPRNITDEVLRANCKYVEEQSLVYLRRSFTSYGLHFHRQLLPPSQSGTGTYDYDAQIQNGRRVVVAGGISRDWNNPLAADDSRFVSLGELFQTEYSIHTNQEALYVCPDNQGEPNLGGRVAISYGNNPSNEPTNWDPATDGVVLTPACPPGSTISRSAIGDVYSHLALNILSNETTDLEEAAKATLRCDLKEEADGGNLLDVVPSWMLGARDAAETQERLLGSSRIIEPGGVLLVEDLEAGGIYFSAGEITLRSDTPLGTETDLPGSVSIVSPLNINVEAGAVRNSGGDGYIGGIGGDSTFSGQGLALISGCDVIIIPDTRTTVIPGVADEMDFPRDDANEGKTSLSWTDGEDVARLANVAVLAPYGAFYPMRWDWLAGKLPSSGIDPADYDIPSSNACGSPPIQFWGSIATGYLGAFVPNLDGQSAADTVLGGGTDGFVDECQNEELSAGFNLIHEWDPTFQSFRPPFWPEIQGGDWQRTN